MFLICSISNGIWYDTDFHPKGCHPSAQKLGSRKLNSTPSKCTVRTRSQCLGTGMTKKGALG
ncbi:hypothetical protein [Wolbachia endosymbiont (group A) of Rhinocyllus conicus]|uniref:hypothetical protein n=1 Tax=Wolbachia endosymbiont (group A) of Rhinocyllus conicus TaxID=2954053 RepID=UPI0022279C8E|nr:hypothetical protein [Wolbachia endosymbiont (group A) of Rhinocyllus conicus]